MSRRDPTISNFSDADSDPDSIASSTKSTKTTESRGFPIHGYNRKGSTFGRVGDIDVEIDDEEIQYVRDASYYARFKRVCTEFHERTPPPAHPTESEKKEAMKQLNISLLKHKDIFDMRKVLREMSRNYYDNLQDVIPFLKTYNRHITGVEIEQDMIEEFVQHVREIYSDYSMTNIRNLAKIQQMTFRIRCLCLTKGVVPGDVLEPKLTVVNLKKLYDTVVDLCQRVLRNARIREQNEETIRNYVKEIRKKFSMVKCWQSRWSTTLAGAEKDQFYPSLLHQRQKLIEQMELETVRVQKELEASQILLAAICGYPHSPEQIRCQLEDQYSELSSTMATLLGELQETRKKVTVYEVEARDLDGLYLEQATLFAAVDSQLRQAYEYFSSRPHLVTVESVKRTEKMLMKAYEKLAEIAHEIDAIFSISDKYEKELSGLKVPRNPYTSFSLKGLWTHWQNVLQCAGEMDTWLNDQKTVVDQLHNKYGKKLDGALLELVNDLYGILKEPHDKFINRALDGERTQQIVNQLAETNLWRKRLDRAVFRINSRRSEYTVPLYDLAEGLHKHGIMTPQLIDMVNCWDHATQTLQLLSDDAKAQVVVLEAPNPTIEELTTLRYLVNRNNEYFSKLNGRLLLPPSSIKINEDKDVVILLDQPDEVSPDFKCDITSEYLKISSRIDPYGRVTCSMWVDMKIKSANTFCRTRFLRQKDLENNFNLLAGGKPYITEEEIVGVLSEMPGLEEWVQKNVTEHFGWESEEDVREGIKCYDYNRFVCKLLGMNRKLSVNPN